MIKENTAQTKYGDETVRVYKGELAWVLEWLTAALECKEWNWCPQQHECATECRDTIQKYLDGEYQTKSTPMKLSLEDYVRPVSHITPEDFDILLGRNK